ncbi:MAG: N-acetylmuramoyl-L-alanine amidase [Proteobacteria bacterium]|nr:N-acetylmuramoyl-L-alanine amidase [Pseudomonadota bacterium]
MRRLASPNCDSRPVGTVIDLLVIHNISLPPGEFGGQAVAHKRAWHAGASMWHGRTACNDFSIGVELEGTDFLPFSDQQYAALIRLTRMLKRTYPIREITGHSDIAPGRKTDPGHEFDWPRYLARG